MPSNSLFERQLLCNPNNGVKVTNNSRTDRGGEILSGIDEDSIPSQVRWTHRTIGRGRRRVRVGNDTVLAGKDELNKRMRIGGVLQQLRGLCHIMVQRGDNGVEVLVRKFGHDMR